MATQPTRSVLLYSHNNITLKMTAMAAETCLWEKMWKKDIVNIEVIG